MPGCVLPVGPAEYLVNEVFATVQGEATNAGRPAVFVRLQGCRVGCAFCDTKHTWRTDEADLVPLSSLVKKASDAPTHARLSAAELAAEVRRVAGGARLVVLTGGEPADHDLRPISRLLQDDGFAVQVETSGTSPLRVAPGTWVTLSPKIRQAGGLEVLEEVVARADEIKHPTSTERHLADLEELLARGWHQPGTPVWLQPLSQHPAATARCLAWCMSRGYYLSVQVHKYIGVR